MSKKSQLKVNHSVSLNPTYHALGAKIAMRNDLSFSGYVDKLIKEDAIKKGLLKEEECFSN